MVSNILNTNILTKIFGSRNERLLKQYGQVVREINALEPALSSLTDDELRGKTGPLRERVANGEELDSVLPEAFAIVREAGKRTLQMRHFDMQLIGGMALHHGKIAVMQRHAADELHEEVPHLQRALARFADNGERFRQDRIELFSVGDALAERTGLAPQFVVGQGGECRLERIDLADHLTVLLEQPLVAAAEDLGQDIGVQDIGNHLRLADAAGPNRVGVRIPSPLPCANAPVWIS